MVLRFPGSAMLLLAALATPPAAAAQTTAVPYGTVREWTVTVNLRDGHFDTCEATSGDRRGDGWISLEAGVNGWLVNTPWPYAEAGLVRGLLGVDGRRIEAGWARDTAAFEATTSLPHAWVDAVAQGGRFEWQVEGHPLNDHPLAGSAAAVLKLRECVALRGETPDPGTVLTREKLRPAPVGNAAARLGAGCPTWGQMASPSSNTPSRLEIVNGTDRAMLIYWIGFDGSMSEYAGLMPGEGTTLDTFAGHLWINKDSDGICHGGVVRAPAGAGRVELR